MKVLVDTCVWSLALRRRDLVASSAHVHELSRLISDYRVVVTGAIRQELLSGIRDPAQFRKVERHLRAFPDLPMESRDYVTAAQFFNQCRACGIQGSNTDFLICAVAARHRLAIYTTDRDFTGFAQHLPITLHEPTQPAPSINTPT